MVRALKFLRYVALAYWRHAFSVRGRYDSIAIFLTIGILVFGYYYLNFLSKAAKSFELGETDKAIQIFIIVFFVWILPVAESQSIVRNIRRALFFPFSKIEIAFLYNCAALILPTTIIAVIVTATAIYPLSYAVESLSLVIRLFLLSLLALFSFVSLFNLLRVRWFRILVFLFVIAAALSVILSPASHNISSFVVARFLSNNFTLALFVLIALVVSVLSSFPSGYADGENSKIGLISRLNPPIRLGLLIKKDLIYISKILDPYLSILVMIVYSIILFASDQSAETYSIAASIAVMLSSSLVFNSFGYENSRAMERYSIFPIRPADLFATKNKAFAILVFFQILVTLPIIFLKFGLVIFISSLLKTVTLCLLYSIWGNNLSARFPFKMRPYEFSLGGSIPAMLVAVVTISLVLILPDFYFSQSIFLKLACDIFVLILAFFAYSYFLNLSSKELASRWEQITQKLQ